MLKRELKKMSDCLSYKLKSFVEILWNGLIGMPVLSDDMTTKSSTNQLSMII